MEYMHKIKKMLCEELEDYAKQKSLSGSDLEMIHKLTDTIKNIDKIMMLEDDDEGYSEMYPYYMHGSSYARGRYAKRDSMGRYSRDNAPYDDYSEERYGRSGYSRDDAKDHLMSKMGEMMRDASPNERKILEEAMRKIDKA